MKKKEDINNYCIAQEAAQILSNKLGRPVRPDYISKMSKSKKHHIRTIRKHSRLMMYHRGDVAACVLGSQVAVAM
ncbi:hypothetical protein KSF_095780 [Reticulibacter mediterranei]|uniref:Uncharacterized protein n=1 Tax=Reticulibacter mediterranei TaxID=2778369 RepID=A0A8J3IW08_9CHLR|nr:hypothetical protein [Reticulibacter mediterranei]GHO99530.1 hypothetical protein KSF_095780 [Reticulibacter mediterranei]